MVNNKINWTLALQEIRIKSEIIISNSIDIVIENFLLLKNSVHTKRAYRGDLLNFFNEIQIYSLEELAYIRFDEIISTIQFYIDGVKKVEELEDRKRVLNAKTVNRKINSLRSFFSYLIQVYDYPKNPLDSINNLKDLRFSNTQSLTRAEVIDLLSYAKIDYTQSQTNYRNYLVIIFLFNLALRREEVANLKWTDINLTNQNANIYQKGGGYKLLPLPFTLCTHLTEFKKLFNLESEYVFTPSRNNSHKVIDKPLSTDYIFLLVKKMAKTVLPDKNITPHSLRKTFIELALNNGDDFISICNATGHSSIEMIKYYDTRDSLKNNSVHSLSQLI